jgi:hypothetical protein
MRLNRSDEVGELSPLSLQCFNLSSAPHGRQTERYNGNGEKNEQDREDNPHALHAA